MEKTVIVRRMDDLGRIVIPREIRRVLFGDKDTSGMPMEICVENDTIVLKAFKSEEDKIQKAISELENLKKCYNGDEDANMKPMSLNEYMQEIIDMLKE